MYRMRIAGPFLLLIALSVDAFGQAGGMFGGSRSVGSGTISAGNRNAFGGGGAAPGAGLDQIGNTGQITGSERFVRDNRTAGQFVGADSADAPFVGALQGGTTGALGGTGFGNFSSGGLGGGLGVAGFGGGRNGQAGRGQTGRANGTQNFNASSSNRQITVRTQLSLGFEHTPISQPTVQQSLQTHLNGVRLKRPRQIQVQMDGRTATLTGRVATSSDRALMLAIAKLEPGVETVVDQLLVASPAEISP